MIFCWSFKVQESNILNFFVFWNVYSPILLWKLTFQVIIHYPQCPLRFYVPLWFFVAFSVKFIRFSTLEKALKRQWKKELIWQEMPQKRNVKRYGLLLLVYHKASLLCPNTGMSLTKNSISLYGNDTSILTQYSYLFSYNDNSDFKETLINSKGSSKFEL